MDVNTMSGGGTTMLHSNIGNNAAAAATNTNSTNNNNSILSSKVSRALEVRSDTPAMKAALEALSHLPAVHQDDLFTVDARSVRVAIEQDALQQALLLQEELRTLLSTVKTLRHGVNETASIARKVDDVIHSNVVTSTIGLPLMISSSSNSSTANRGGGNGLDDGIDDPSSIEMTGDGGGEQQEYNTTSSSGLLVSSSSSSSNAYDIALKKEQHLAAVLSDCFMKRNLARQRVQTVHEFLERFDLSEEDARLLDHYAFEDVETTNVNGNAFLVALDRVRIIRIELSKAFGGAGAGGSSQLADNNNTKRLYDTATTMSSSSLLTEAAATTMSSSNSRLGTSSALRMMETLAQKQERAYERLYHWLQKYLQLHSQYDNNNSNNNPSSSSSYRGYEDDHLDECLSHPFVRESLSTLRHVPAFYSHLLELIAQSRRTEETRRFLLALTSGYGGLPPIEIRAHDSVVYVGDMLAFCFRAFSVEADIAKGLLVSSSTTITGGGNSGGGTIQEEEEYDIEEEEGKENNDKNKETTSGTSSSSTGVGEDHATDDGDDDGYMVEKPMSPKEMLHQSMGGLSRPLKSRILQVISNLARRRGRPSNFGNDTTGYNNNDDDDDDDDDDRDSDDGLMNGLDEEGTLLRTQLSQLYEICGLLLFYASALEKSLLKVSTLTLGSGGSTTTSTGPVDYSSTDARNKNPLIGALLDCLGEATNGYGVSLRVYSAMLEQLNLVTGDSEASLAHAMIVKLVDVRKVSPGFVQDVDCPGSYEQTLSLDWACTVLVDAALPSCKTLDDTVSLKQSIAVAKQGGLTDSVVRVLETKLQDREAALVDVLVERESTDVLDLCGLGTLLTAWDRYQRVQVEGMTMAGYPGLTLEEVDSTMKEFYSSLYSPPIPSFENTIKDPTLRKLARTKIAATVCTKYSTLYDAMIKPDIGGYDDVSFLGHTPQQVTTLFSV
jgi:hypothetical protein